MAIGLTDVVPGYILKGYSAEDKNQAMGKYKGRNFSTFDDNGRITVKVRPSQWMEDATKTVTTNQWKNDFEGMRLYRRLAYVHECASCGEWDCGQTFHKDNRNGDVGIHIPYMLSIYSVDREFPIDNAKNIPEEDYVRILGFLDEQHPIYDETRGSDIPRYNSDYDEIENSVITFCRRSAESMDTAKLDQWDEEDLVAWDMFLSGHTCPVCGRWNTPLDCMYCC